MHDCYRNTDAFVLPSFAEGIPVVLMEAMASGIPCVTTRITGIPELIRDDVDGLLVTPSDVDELVDALTRLMDDASIRERIAQAGRTRIESHYNLERNIMRLAHILQQHLEVSSC